MSEAPRVKDINDRKIAEFKRLAQKRWESPDAAIGVNEKAIALIGDLETERAILYEQLDAVNRSGIL